MGFNSAFKGLNKPQHQWILPHISLKTGFSKRALKTRGCLLWLVSLNLSDTLDFYFSWRNSTSGAKASSLPIHHDYTQLGTSRSVGPLWMRDQPDNTTLSGTVIHISSGIRTRNSSKGAAADPRLRPRGHWDRPLDKSWHWQQLRKTPCFNSVNC